MNASQLTDNQVQKLLGEGEDQKIKVRLHLLRRNNLRDDNDSDNNDEDDGSGKGGSSTARGHRISKKRPLTMSVFPPVALKNNLKQFLLRHHDQSGKRKFRLIYKIFHLCCQIY